MIVKMENKELGKIIEYKVTNGFGYRENIRSFDVGEITSPRLQDYLAGMTLKRTSETIRLLEILKQD